MKTIKSIIKDFLSRNHVSSPDENSECNNFYKPNEKNENETKNHEALRDPELADSGSPETDRDDKKTTRQSGNQPSTSPGGEERPLNPQPESNNKTGIDDVRLKTLLEEAFQKGVIEGRNQQIEERFFPKDDDGIPQFHGSPSAHSGYGDIFSMAREA